MLPHVFRKTLKSLLAQNQPSFGNIPQLVYPDSDFNETNTPIQDQNLVSKRSVSIFVCCKTCKPVTCRFHVTRHANYENKVLSFPFLFPAHGLRDRLVLLRVPLPTPVPAVRLLPVPEPVRAARRGRDPPRQGALPHGAGEGGSNRVFSPISSVVVHRNGEEEKGENLI